MKKELVACLFIFFAGLISGCDIVGGGVAGAGYDPIWKVNEAKNYTAKLSQKIEEPCARKPHAGICERVAG